MTGVDVGRYLDRIGFDKVVRHDVATLEALQRAHLTAVPFENLHVFHRRGVQTSINWSVPKVVDERRGGWCFELNGAFAALLHALGFEVKRLAANVLLGDVASATPDHLTLEVALDQPYLVDVGFGDSAFRPLPLDDPGPHETGIGPYVIETEGPTTRLVDASADHPLPLYRFERLAVDMAVFDPSSQPLQTEPGLHWTDKPFATRLLDGGPDRVTLLADRIKFRTKDEWREEPVKREHWKETLQNWFGMAP